MGIVDLILLMLILARVQYLASVGNATLSRDEFFECLRRMDSPAVLVTQRTVFWVLGFSRYQYTCAYKGHHLHLKSFAPVDLPSAADTIRVRKW